MLKKITYFLLALSLIANVYFVINEVQFIQRSSALRSIKSEFALDVQDVKWKTGFAEFVKKIKAKNPELSSKKYYYINIWTTWCKPCIREMPWIDSLAGTLKQNVAYFFVSEIGENRAKECIKAKKLQIKTFHYYDDMGAFVSAICSLKKVKSKVYPMNLIINNRGDVLYFYCGGYSNRRESANFTELIKSIAK